MSGWNGWQYGQAQPPSVTNNTPSNGPSVNYVQLDWKDLFGGAMGGEHVVTSSTSPFRLENQPAYEGYGKMTQPGQFLFFFLQ